MLKNGKRISQRRRYTEDFKKKVVQDFESGKCGILELERMYSIPNTSIYRWVYKYSRFNERDIQVVEMKDSQSEKIKQMEARIKELERAVGQKQMNIDFLEKMIELADDHYKIDIKKNSNTPHSGGSKTTKKK
ncbi:transposase [Gilvibacter sp.]|uniref:transposase n=1 Tax=Gilvibacter sp. TaxID=2729997 RepID=UPI0025C3850A|nr:transposase [Gilvibacter sp.]NQX78935.1 transposase [Gilvibacter sp.]NQX92397.1 transposase [Flavobacteriales bacterium]